MTTTGNNPQLTDYQHGVAAYWDATANPDTDPQNVRLGQLDGIYHHHYGLGNIDPHMPDNPDDNDIIRELHRLETNQTHTLLDQFNGHHTTADRHGFLDAGCGRGGTSFLAHHRYGCRVDGVTISPYQADFANAQADERGLSNHVRFHLADMLNTPFPDADFQGIWNNESTMYVDLHELYREVARLLRPGGRYVCITGAHADEWGTNISPAITRINERYRCHVHPRSTYLTALLHHDLVPIHIENLTPRTLPYWKLRQQSTVATGVEADFLEAYREGSFHYLLIVADRT